MRQGSALLLGLFVCALAGCAGAAPTQSTSWFNRFMRPAGPSGPDVVQMDVALIERPLGDSYLNRELWAVADEQVIAPEAQAMLEDNGFRIGQMGGITPAGLQNLLTSEQSCINPRRLMCHAGKPTRLVLGPALPLCSYHVLNLGAATEVNLEQAECTVEVVPTLAADGRTTLRFVPQVQHGAANLMPKPAADRSGWILTQDRPTERYPQIAWEVSLAPNEYVVVGGRFDRPGTLGNQSFVRTGEQPAMQRLLVIRTSRPGQALDEPAPQIAAEEVPRRRAPSLASQAALTATRGTSQ